MEEKKDEIYQLIVEVFMKDGTNREFQCGYSSKVEDVHKIIDDIKKEIEFSDKEYISFKKSTEIESVEYEEILIKNSEILAIEFVIFRI